MISAIIASYKEPNTIGRAISSLAPQLRKGDEIILTAPDKATQEAARNAENHGIPVRIIADKGKGKPAALNLAAKKAKNKLLLLTDGDVYVSKNTVPLLSSHMQRSNVGIATGRVVSTNPRNTLFGFWAYALTEAFHRLRSAKTHRAIATGYLYIIRKELLPLIPEETLADDAFVSHTVEQKGQLIIYEQNAYVYVKYPTTLPDWLRQKKRTAGRVYQLERQFGVSKTRSLYDELAAALATVRCVDSVRDIFYLLALFILKAYVWARVFFDYRLWRRSFKNVWTRVESTK